MAEHDKDGKDVDPATGIETTQHEWDGIKELNNPMPRWWLWTFYATVAWSLVYVILYPAIPLVDEATGGVLGYSTRGAVEEEIAEARAAQAEYAEAIASSDFAEIAADPDLNRFALRGGAAVFRTFCAQCHGEGAAGFVGYPNLLDDDWLWGGSIEEIHHTIAHGIRVEGDDRTRYSEMPAFGEMDLLDRSQIQAVTEYVLALSGQEHNEAMAADGETLYADNCAACHGAEGEGVQELGAPNLADAIWLYGGDRDDIMATITYSRAGMMPAWTGRLTDEQLKQVALYVHALGGGE